MGKGGKEQSHGSSFSPRGCSVQRVEGAQHNHAAEMGPTGLHTLVPGNISSLDKAFRLTCLVTTCGTWPAWQEENTTSLQGFSISSPLQLRNWDLRVLPSISIFAYYTWDGLKYLFPFLLISILHARRICSFVRLTLLRMGSRDQSFMCC